MFQEIPDSSEGQKTKNWFSVNDIEKYTRRIVQKEQQPEFHHY